MQFRPPPLLGYSKRCVPGAARCVRCTEMGIEDCRYCSVKKRGIGTTLRMGQACVPCRSVFAGGFPKGVCVTDLSTLLSLVVRRKKIVSVTFKVRSRGLTSPHQRCDGKQPCTTCVNGERDAGCTYEPRQESRRSSTKVLSARDGAVRPQIARALPSKASANMFSLSEPLIRSPFGVPQPTWSGSGKPGPSLTPLPTPCERPLTPSPRVRRERMLGPLSDVSTMRNIPDTTERVPRPVVSSFTVLPSIHFRTIPLPLQLPLSLIQPERVQVSPIAGGDLGMTLYVLSRIPKFHRVVGTKPQYGGRYVR